MTEEQKRAVFNNAAFYGGECNCGSGLDRKEVLDARGIFVSYVCQNCYSEILDGYRYDIFVDSNYATDEEIEGDY